MGGSEEDETQPKSCDEEVRVRSSRRKLESDSEDPLLQEHEDKEKNSRGSSKKTRDATSIVLSDDEAKEVDSKISDFFFLMGRDTLAARALDQRHRKRTNLVLTATK